MTLRDESLIREAQQGNLAAFEELIHRYEPKVLTLAYRLMGNHPDAADAAQEALVKVYVRLPGFRGDSAFSTWLFRVVTNTCLDELRRRKRTRLPSLDEPQRIEHGDLQRQLPTDDDSPEMFAERRELRRDVQKAINQLQVDYRIVVVLRDIQDLSYREIAEALGCSVNTVKSRLHRARVALRQLILSRKRPA